jgi:hypothetical protein
MKIRYVLKPVTIVLFLLMILSGVALADQSNRFVKELKHVDVFHPPKDSSQMLLYNEWQYFNIMDEKQNLSIACSFQLNGALNASEVFFGYHTKNGTSNASPGAYPLSITKYSALTPDVIIANSTVKLTPDGYSVHVASDDGSKVLDALFIPESEPSPDYISRGFSPAHGGIINWLVASPKMKVNGKLTVDGKKYILKNAIGYHDHDWGYWNWNDLGWDWGQVTETKKYSNGNDIGKYSLNFGNFTDANHTRLLNPVLNLWSNQELATSFSGKHTQIKHSNFVNVTIPLYPGAELPSGSFPLPLNTNISASSRTGDYLNIKFTTELENSSPVPVPVPMVDSSGHIIVKYRLIWEMLGIYKVEGKIKGKPVSFIANGFMEYVSGGSILPTQKS